MKRLDSSFNIQGDYCFQGDNNLVNMSWVGISRFPLALMSYNLQKEGKNIWKESNYYSESKIINECNGFLDGISLDRYSRFFKGISYINDEEFNLELRVSGLGSVDFDGIDNRFEINNNLFSIYGKMSYQKKEYTLVQMNCADTKLAFDNALDLLMEKDAFRKVMPGVFNKVSNNIN